SVRPRRDGPRAGVVRAAGRALHGGIPGRPRQAFILEVCKTPELAAQVTLQPIERFPLDAAIIFADILLPLEPMGLRITFEEGEGPVIHNPVRTRADVDALRLVGGEELRFVAEAIRLARRALDGRVPLIGFAGAPFTLASYAIEGGASRHYIETKSLMYREPAVWHRLPVKFEREQVEGPVRGRPLTLRTDENMGEHQKLGYIVSR